MATFIQAPIEGQFTTGLCDICAEPGGAGLCLYTVCCPCCSFGAAVDKAPPDVTCANNCVAGCCFELMCPIIADFAVRSSMRASYNIQGDLVKDCLIAFCCPLCNTCQMSREVVIRNAAKSKVAMQTTTLAPQQQQMVQQFQQPPPQQFQQQPAVQYVPQQQPGQVLYVQQQPVYVQAQPQVVYVQQQY